MAKSVEQREFEEKEYSQWCENNKEYLIRFLSENLGVETDIGLKDNYKTTVNIKLILNGTLLSEHEDWF